jgi:hypothetical protein
MDNEDDYDEEEEEAARLRRREKHSNMRSRISWRNLDLELMEVLAKLREMRQGCRSCKKIEAEVGELRRLVFLLINHMKKQGLAAGSAKLGRKRPPKPPARTAQAGSGRRGAAPNPPVASLPNRATA